VPGTTSHLAGELFKLMAKVDMLHVPYKGKHPGDHRSARRPDLAAVRDNADGCCRTPRRAG